MNVVNPTPVASEIHQTYPYISPPSLANLNRAGTFRGDLASSTNSAPRGGSGGVTSGVGEKGKEGETGDGAFIEDVRFSTHFVVM